MSEPGNCRGIYPIHQWSDHIAWRERRCVLGSLAKAAQFIMPDQLSFFFFPFQPQSFCCPRIMMHALIGGKWPSFADGQSIILLHINPIVLECSQLKPVVKLFQKYPCIHVGQESYDEKKLPWLPKLWPSMAFLCTLAARVRTSRLGCILSP